MIQSMKVYRWSKRAQRRKWRMESESRGRLFLKTPEEKRRSAKDLLVSRVSSEVRNNFTMHFIIGNHLHAEWTRKWDHIQGFDQGFVCVSRLTAVSMTEGTLGDYPSHYLRDYSFHYQSMGLLSMAQREISASDFIFRLKMIQWKTWILFSPFEISTLSEADRDIPFRMFSFDLQFVQIPFDILKNRRFATD